MHSRPAGAAAAGDGDLAAGEHQAVTHAREPLADGDEHLVGGELEALAGLDETVRPFLGIGDRDAGDGAPRR